jgi:hypothetical protein
VIGQGDSHRVGSFRFYLAEQRWEWSETVERMHGYDPGTVTATRFTNGLPDTCQAYSWCHQNIRRALRGLVDLRELRVSPGGRRLGPSSVRRQQHIAQDGHDPSAER